MLWMISANPKIYNIEKRFTDENHVFWRQNYNFNVGDFVYIYITKPVAKLMYLTQVIDINLDSNSIEENQIYWNNKRDEEVIKSQKYSHLSLISNLEDHNLTLNTLLENGLKAAPQGSIILSETLKSFLSSVIFNAINKEKEVELEDIVYIEGEYKSYLTKKYERNLVARKECIKHHGNSCFICGFNFEAVYGDIGKDYIHVHHIIPISRIGKTYEVDPKNDLIPVCPNCHAMIHKYKDVDFKYIEELKTKFKKN